MAVLVLGGMLLGAPIGHAQSGGAVPPLSNAEATRFCALARENADQFNYQRLILAVRGCEQAGSIDDATLFFLLLSQK
jgi:hypothetical protein